MSSRTGEWSAPSSREVRQPAAATWVGERHPLVALSVADWIGIVWRVWIAQMIVGTLIAGIVAALVTTAWVVLAVIGVAVFAGA